jgi:two-component sensor histidine kinase
MTRDLLETYNVSEGKISLNNHIEPLKLDVESVIPLGLIVNELMSNALKYAFPEDRDGSIEVILKEEDGYLYLQVGDNGIGLDEKQLKVKQDSFGHTLIKAFRNKLDAEINISANEGTIVSLKIAKYKKVV